MSLLEALRYILLTLTGVGMTFLLADWRYSPKKTLAIVGGCTAAIIAVNLLIYNLWGLQLFGIVYPLTTNGAALLLLFFVSRQRGLFLVFSLLTAISMCGIVVLPGIWLVQVLGAPVWVEILARLAVTVPVMIFLYRHFRPAYLSMLKIMRRGWGWLCLMPLAFYTMFYLLFMRKLPTDFSQPLILILLALVIVAVAYGVIFILFQKTVRESQLRDERALLKTQVQAMERQAEAIQKSDEQVRIYRHDMRHYIAEIATLLDAGNIQEARRVLGSVDTLTRQTVLPRYCENPTVNAILTYFFKQAADAGIAVEAKCCLHGELPIESAELAMVVANAMENAIHACCRLPETKERKITVRMISSPQLVLEVANTYDGRARFDDKGLPLAETPGHGIGTRSILAFVEKHGALLDYKADASVFRLRLLINTP